MSTPWKLKRMVIEMEDGQTYDIPSSNVESILIHQKGNIKSFPIRPNDLVNQVVITFLVEGTIDFIKKTPRLGADNDEVIDPEEIEDHALLP